MLKGCNVVMLCVLGYTGSSRIAMGLKPIAMGMGRRSIL